MGLHICVCAECSCVQMSEPDKAYCVDCTNDVHIVGQAQQVSQEAANIVSAVTSSPHHSLAVISSLDIVAAGMTKSQALRLSFKTVDDKGVESLCDVQTSSAVLERMLAICVSLLAEIDDRKVVNSTRKSRQ